jgi:hypothetical protein
MTHDEWRLLRYGILTASLMALIPVPILVHDRNFPKSAAEGILGAATRPSRPAIRRSLAKSSYKVVIS